MSTLLSAITNSPYRVSNIEDEKESILQKLNDLNLQHCWDIEQRGKREEGEWECELMQFEDEIEYDFTGPFMNSISVYPHGVVIHSCYKLNILYLNFNLHWFAELRQELFQIMRIFEGDEMFFLSDGGNPLSGFNAKMIDGKTYYETKQNLQSHFGNPVTNYRYLNKKLTSYNQISEWFLDDFSDLKNGFNSYADIEPNYFL